MTRASPRATDELKWVSFVLFLAALYNVAWGAVAMVAPGRMLAWVGVSGAFPIEFWQCVGMLVALYGAAYGLAAADPLRYWPFVAVGLVGKLLGPLGAAFSVASGGLPARFLWINLGNDLVWWAPFAWILWTIRRHDATAAGSADGRPLYRRVLGRRFDELTPRIRRFHDATQPVEVRGAFAVTRGTSSIGSWLTDRSGFPRARESLDVSLVVEPAADGERWRRTFGDSVVESWQCQARGHLAERFGPLVMYLRAGVVAGGLEVTDVRSSFFGIPLPPFLTPRVHAYGIDSDDGIEVTVRISSSPFGLLVEYRGRVRLV